MKKLVTPLVAVGLLLSASPAFAYTVNTGDTLSQIAVNEHLTLGELIKLNPKISNPNLIFPNETINTSGGTAGVIPVDAPRYSDYQSDDLDLLARIVNAEAKGESYAGKVAVAKVILNRAASPMFPNTIREVVYESGQFQPVANGSINNEASAESTQAAKEVLETYTGNPNGALYFYNPKSTSDSWIRTRTVVGKVGNQIFSR